MVDGSMQDCGISSVNALEIPQSCTDPSLYASLNWEVWKYKAVKLLVTKENLAQVSR